MINPIRSILQSKDIINSFVHKYFKHKNEFLYKSAINIIQQIKDENIPSTRLYILIDQFKKILHNLSRIPTSEIMDRSIFDYLVPTTNSFSSSHALNRKSIINIPSSMISSFQYDSENHFFPQD